MQLFLYEKRNDLMNVIDFFYNLIYFFLIVYNVFECSIKIWCQRPSHLLLFYCFMQNIFHIAAFKCFFIKNRNHLKWHFSTKNYVLRDIKKPPQNMSSTMAQLGCVILPLRGDLAVSWWTTRWQNLHLLWFKRN